MWFLAKRNRVLTILTPLFAVLISVSASAATQSYYKLGYPVSYTMRIGKGWIAAQANVSRVDNWDQNSSSPALSIQLWLSTRRYRIGSRIPVLLLAKQNLPAIKADSYYQNIHFTSAGAKSIKSGKYYVIMALTDAAQKHVFDAAVFTRQIKVR